MNTTLAKRTTTATPTTSKINTMTRGLIAALHDFNILLTTETAFLKKADFKAVEALQDEKRVLARTYHDIVTSFSEVKSDMSSLDLKLREQLVTARAEFTVTLSENIRALEASKNSTKRLIDRIIETARDTVIDEKQTHYSEKGKTGSYKSATLSVSIDQSL